MQTDFDKNANPKAILMPEFDELQFKAIGEGLGFHQQQEKPRWQQPQVKVSPSTSQRSSLESFKATPAAATTISREQLGAIYQPQAVAPKESPLTNTNIKTKTEKKLASLPERLSAQVTDLLIVSGAVMGMLALMLLAARVPMEHARSLLLSWDVAPVVGVLWLFAYVSYFTILETRQTPGKMLMRLRVVDQDGEALTLSRALERTTFRTLSWLALGFPLLMDFHGRLSRTKVVRA